MTGIAPMYAAVMGVVVAQVFGWPIMVGYAIIVGAVTGWTHAGITSAERQAKLKEGQVISER